MEAWFRRVWLLCLGLLVSSLLLSGCRPAPSSELRYLGAVHTSGQAVAGFECFLVVYQAPEGALPTWDFEHGPSVAGGQHLTYSDGVIGVSMAHTWDDPGTYTVRATIEGVGYWEGQVQVVRSESSVDLLELLGVRAESISAIVLSRYAGDGAYAHIGGEVFKLLVEQFRIAHPVKTRSMLRAGDQAKLHLLSVNGVYLGAVTYRDGVLSLWNGSDQWLLLRHNGRFRKRDPSYRCLGDRVGGPG